MARGLGFLTAIERAGRLAVQQQRRAEAASRRHAREQARALREQLRLQAQFDKAQRQLYLENRVSEAEELTAEVEETVNTLRGILEFGLQREPRIAFSSLLLPEATEPFCPPAGLTTPCVAPQREEFTKQVKPPSMLEKIFGDGGRFERDRHEAESRYAEAEAAFRAAEEARTTQLSQMRANYEVAQQRRVSEVRQRNTDVTMLENAYIAGEPAAIKAYCSMVLDRSDYPGRLSS